MHKNTRWLVEWANRMNIKFGIPKTGYDWCRKLAYAMDEAGNDHPSCESIEKAIQWENAKFANTFCSQCGKEFGPGNHGFSHCQDHNKSIKEMEE